MWQALRVAVVLLVLAAPAAAGTPRLSPAQVALMVLERSAYGPIASRFTIGPDSGFVSNAKEAANREGTGLTERAMNRLGRLTGYQLQYISASAFASQRGAFDAQSEVEFFRSPRGASEYLRREVAALRRGVAVPGLPGARLQVTTFRASFGDEAVGIRARASIGRARIYETGVAFRRGTLVASTELIRADPVDTRTRAKALAAALEKRIQSVLAGKVQGQPVPLPPAANIKLGGLGRPQGGPDLAAMALTPADLGSGAKVIAQRYVRNPEDVADYMRNFGPLPYRSSNLLGLEDEVALARDPGEALTTFASIGFVLGSPQAQSLLRSAFGTLGSVAKQVKLRPGRLRTVAAGDGAIAMDTLVTGPAARLHFTLSFVRVGEAVQTLVFVARPGSALADADVDAALRAAAGHMRTALARTP